MTRVKAAQATAELRWAWLVGPNAQVASDAILATNEHLAALETCIQSNPTFQIPKNDLDPHNLDLDTQSLALMCRMQERELVKQDCQVKTLQNTIIKLQAENTRLVSETVPKSPTFVDAKGKGAAPASPSTSSPRLGTAMIERNASFGNNSLLQLSLLQTQIATLTEALSSSNRQSATFKQKIEYLESSLQESSSQLSLSESRIADLTSRILDMEQELGTALTRSEESESQVQQLKSTVAEQEQTISDLEEKLASTEQEADSWKLQFQEKENDIQRSVSVSKEVSDTMKEKFMAQVLDRDTKIQTLERNLDHVEQENNKLASRVDELSVCLAKYESERVSSLDETTELLANLESLQSRFDSVQHERVAFKSRMETLDASNKELETLLAQSTVALDSSRSRISELEVSLSESRQSIESIEEDLLSRLNAKQAELDAMMDVKLVVEEELGSTRDKLKAAMASSSNSLGLLSSSRSIGRLDDNNDANENQEHEINRLRNQNESLVLDLQQQQSEYQTTIQQLQLEISVLQTKFSHQLQQSQQQSQQHHDHYNKQITSVELENTSVSSESTSETLHLLDNAIGLMQVQQPQQQQQRSITSPYQTSRSNSNSITISNNNQGNNHFLTPISSASTVIFSPSTPPPPPAPQHHPASCETCKQTQDALETLSSKHFQKEMEWLAQLVSTQQQGITTITSLRTQLETSALEATRLKNQVKELGSELLWKENEVCQVTERGDKRVGVLREGVERALRVYNDEMDLGEGGARCELCVYLKEKVERLEKVVEDERKRWVKAEEDLLRELEMLSA
ncbi:UNVERIFIED_CONTAM: hypothetical protein HDU68_009700 [Siphonaria sp. JEL0065]|nr:hypothetical protein HDU68_009700 [Siphonaria sp. JEL0065]